MKFRNRSTPLKKSHVVAPMRKKSIKCLVLLGKVIAMKNLTTSRRNVMLRMRYGFATAKI